MNSDPQDTPLQLPNTFTAIAICGTHQTRPLMVLKRYDTEYSPQEGGMNGFEC